jgi:plasmid stabilization system protein ParE
MVKQFHILPEAEQDAADAYGWHEERQPGLGEEFLRCVEACIQSIRRNPEAYSVVHGSYRRALVRRFPYAVFYEYAEDTVTIYAIFHCSQDPQKWRVRLP